MNTGSPLQVNLDLWLQAQAPRARSMSVAVGWLSPQGLTALVDLLSGPLRRDDFQLRVLFGELNSVESSSIGTAKSEFGEQLQIRQALRAAGSFHPKVYLVELAEGWTAYVGSANLSNGGLRNNEELGVIGDVGSLAGLTQWFDDQWNRATKVIDSWDFPKRPGGHQALERSSSGGVLVSVTSWIKESTVPLDATQVEGAIQSAFNGQILTYSRDTRLTVRFVDKGAASRLRSVAGQAQRALRSISVNSPWGRFVPEPLHHELRGVLKKWNEQLMKVARECRRGVLERSAIEEILDTELPGLVECLEIDELEADQFVTDMRQSVFEAYEDFAGQQPRNVGARIVVEPAPLMPRIGMSRVPAPFRAWAESTADAEWRDWCVTCASAPRRSLRKYGNVKRARQLALREDVKMRELCDSWESQGDLFGHTHSKERVLEELESQLDVVHGWRSLGTLTEALDALDAFLSDA